MPSTISLIGRMLPDMPKKINSYERNMHVNDNEHLFVNVAGKYFDI